MRQRWIDTFLATLFAVALAWLVTDAEAAKPVCGDGVCKGNETAQSCPFDCTGGPVCGNGTCESGESCSDCAADCGACPPSSCNNDGICNAGEDCLGCADCPGRTSGKPSNRFCCGAGTCDEELCGANACTAPSECGNGLLENGEQCDDGNTANGDGCDSQCQFEPASEPIPGNQFNVGDSIGEAEAAEGTIGATYHDRVWSTGYNGSDGVLSLNERFAAESSQYTPNDATLDVYFNQAVSGAVMADFAQQAQEVVAAASAVPSGQVGMVTILLGNNDVCASSLDTMTDPVVFENQYRAGLDVLASANVPDNVNLQISGLPAIYWLWESKYTNFGCRLIWPFVPCQNLLSGASNDCASTQSREDPDNVYPGDGADCQRRKAFHAEIRDTYNPIIENVLSEYRADGKLQNADYVDIFDIRFDAVHVNNGDCFHPSTAGHSLMAEEQWCRSRWGEGTAQCAP